MDDPSLYHLARRLDSVEREVRWWRRAAALGVLLVCGVFLMGQGQPRMRVVQTEQFILTDALGNPRARLEVLPNGMTSFSLYDSAGVARLGLGVENDGSADVIFMGPDRAVRASIIASASGHTVMQVGAQRLMLSALADGSTSLLLTDKAGRPRAELGVDPKDPPVLRFWNEHALAARYRQNSVTFYGAGERPRLLIALQADGGPLMTLSDGAGRVIWKAP